MPNKQFFATVAKGLEELLVTELTDIGAHEVKQTRAGVYFSGGIEIAYRACLWSRLANHILLPIVSFEAKNQEELYQEIKQVEWLKIMRSNSTFKIDVNGMHETINNTQFIAQKAKDAIVDQIRDLTNERPDIQKNKPDLVLNIYVNRNNFSVSLSLSGESLHKRGYRLEGGSAPIRETLAAGVLMRSGWLEQMKTEAPCLIDPMCGSGTLLVEAAFMAYNIAPGLERSYYGFYGWLEYNESLWNEIEDEAEQIKRNNLQNKHIQILGSDISSYMVQIAEDNIKRAGLSNKIHVEQNDATNISTTGFDNSLNIKTGIVVFNPPYGERLNSGEEDELKDTFKQVGSVLKENFNGWDLAVITSAPELMKSIGIRSYKRYKMFNGALPADLLKFQIQDEFFMLYETPQQKIARQGRKLSENPSEHSLMFENRLKKKLKHISRWARREEISCYRIYDADLPDFSMAIDLYEGHIHIQEYQAGKDIDPKKAELRVLEAFYGVHKVMGIPLDNIHIKVRKKQKGEQQYTKLADNMQYITVKEGQAKFYVNFEDYLDTGLFLDHRLMREKVAKDSCGKTLLNLFAYTCAASVQAALHEAKSVTSVDMSNTYLEWGERNFELNKLSTKKNEFIQADCFKWLESNREFFDVIFLDPPTFSNSKRMDDTLDVQRDHVDLIKLTMRSLKHGGKLFFSNNYRRFKFDSEALSKFKCEDISHQCLPEDFKRRPNIHQCWLIEFS
ncbi:MAG: 23S rRNA (guanine2445-N2)-methyltransferase / 23S rRNA (guanine2069-N7)-methyltransferase [Francisellaceae bacterium]|jgi:23S rRNA (guanine2445-N2)-methyltransferase / 23S rRNA (guanine2069-N7)-methyltransferase